MKGMIVLALKSSEIDLEFTQFQIQKGKTYLDDRTTVFDAYIAGGLNDGSFEQVKRRSDTIIVTSRGWRE